MGCIPALIGSAASYTQTLLLIMFYFITSQLSEDCSSCSSDSLNINIQLVCLHGHLQWLM